MKYFKNITVRFDDNDLDLLDRVKKIYRGINPVYQNITTSQILRGSLVYLYLELVKERESNNEENN